MVKTFNDPVHGHLELDETCVQVVDTPQFQRLRELKQTGAAYHVFPGASHNRFEHSIGVCHLSGVLIQRFRTDQPELEISDFEVKCIKLAGLCHDLGHGPFSHLFDSEFIPRARPGINWSHEVASEDMLDYMIRENELNISSEELVFIKDLIHGKPRSMYPQSHPDRQFLFEIVSNSRNSVDVDKFDYIERDCQNVNVKSSVDTARLMAFSRVIQGRICYNQKDAFNVYELFRTRYSLFKRVYTHKVGKAIEYMISDILFYADPVLNISQSIDDMSRYIHMTDSILRVIDSSPDPRLERSRRLIKRLNCRDLYRFVDQVNIPLDLVDVAKENITSDSIATHNVAQLKKRGIQLTSDDVIVEWLTLSFAMKDRNPLDSITYFSKQYPDQFAQLTKEQISGMITDQFKETMVRIYTRDAEKTAAVQSAFRELVLDLDSELNPEQGSEDTFEDDVVFEREYPRREHENRPSTPTLSPVKHHGILSPFKGSTASKTPSPSKLGINYALTLPEEDTPRKRIRFDV